MKKPRSQKQWPGIGLCALIFLLPFLSPIEDSFGQATDDAFWSFSKIRSDTNADNELDYLGEEVTITGIANISTSLLHEHYLQAFVQNDSAGMSIFSNEIDTPFAPGDSLVVSGKVQRYNGLAEVNADSYRVFSKTSQVPAPKPLKKAIANPSEYLGMLVEGEGSIIEKGSTFNGKYLRISSGELGSGTIMVYVSNFHRLFNQFNFDVLSAGDKILVKGIISENNPDFPDKKTYKLFLRTPGDLEYVEFPKYYMLLIIGGLVLLTALIIGWVVVLRKQVDSKTSKIQQSLEEKEILLQEIHHRVKNSLAIVSGLIELQLDSTDSDEAKSVLQDSQTRIRSMALIHEKLYQTKSLSDITLNTYVKELVEAIHSTFTEYNEAVDLKFELDEIELDIDRVIPCGLLINELVVNAFKHAFKKDKKGILEVGLFRENGNIKLSVADNGPGLPDDFAIKDKGNLGSMLIYTFAEQLDADIEAGNTTKGSKFVFTFPTN
ncbi:histidine kinase dimerization/phosphoacceptor domain -containing protein [Fodinibius sp.]|uniref:histidine kinase dimerization/phosphoacceptor domain -containing protein n=1 Tax=Fodinibius sp. TaxID=1872440 RepID=UPI002ACD7B31|nr:histidine kinase dimerization/phosphoacceptor domain -containing protein [Fodinibius sp.]MDZ7658526.1 histidine kinase dimerization/phosphoacceptor domain -containing protein [Fodinibius sp.]